MDSRRLPRMVARSQFISDRVGFLLVVAVTILVASIVALANPGLSPNDEEQHLDYVDKIGSLHIVRSGDMLGQVTLRTEACRGFYGPYQPPALCGAAGELNPTLFQWGGLSGAWAHTPVYYSITRILMIPAGLVFPHSDFVDRARIATTVWLAFAMGLMWMVFRKLGISDGTNIAVLILLGLNGNVMQRAATVTNDATAVFAGAVLLYAALYVRHRSVLFLLAGLVVALKAQNVIAILCAVVICLLVDMDARRGFSRSFGRFYPSARALDVISLIAGGAVSILVWRVLQRKLVHDYSVATTIGSAIPVDSASWGFASDMVVEYSHMFDGTGLFLPSFQSPIFQQPLGVVTSMLFMGAAVGSVLVLRRRSLGFAAGLSASVGVLLGPVVLFVGIGLVTGVWVVWLRRYGLAVTPFFALSLALMVRTAFARGFVTVFAVLTALVFVYLLIQTMVR
jgi:hypothetical protein